MQYFLDIAWDLNPKYIYIYIFVGSGTESHDESAKRHRLFFFFFWLNQKTQALLSLSPKIKSILASFAVHQIKATQPIFHLR
jgi:hypothetical protein